KAGVPLLVDNAHGSHLGAFGLHPLHLGAYMTADSCHKTLPVLTGGAMLHIGRAGEDINICRHSAKAAMALFGSTSPSFPVMASLDLARDWWERAGVEAYNLTAGAVSQLKKTAEDFGIHVLKGGLHDPARFTLELREDGVDGFEAAQFLRERGCEPEYADSCFAVFIVTPFNTPEHLRRLENAVKELSAEIRRGRFLKKLKRKRFYGIYGQDFERPKAVMTPREAVLQPNETVDTLNAVGRISATAASICPPGIAAVVPGEEITPEVAQQLLSIGINSMVVVKG
ncbi:MAG TPA: amino acid decarboxylase, partial [Candidatus Avimonas sp.]|nr:amino acid decarboxylase [Candidatus Avimonas sp.]